jgi:hypothetical protein
MTVCNPQVYEGLFAGTLPVYRGSPSISKFMPGDDSFINANNMNPQELAALLTELAADESKDSAVYMTNIV